MAAAVPLVLTVASAAVTAIGAIRQGRAADRAASYNASVAEQNAKLARQQAQAQAAQIDRQNRLRIGSIRAKIGGAGIRQSGSAIDVLGDVVSQGELDKQNAIFRGEIDARGYESTATLDRMQGKAARKAGYLKAGSALLEGGASGYNRYQEYNMLTREG